MPDSIIGILAILVALAILAGAILSLIFLIVWLAVSPEKKKRYSKLSWMSLMMFGVGIIAAILMSQLFSV